MTSTEAATAATELADGLISSSAKVPTNGTVTATSPEDGSDDRMDWDLARRVAVRIAGDEPLFRSYLADGLRQDFAKATPLAEELVQAETRLTSSAGDAHAVVIDRATWIDANLRSFRRLLKPVLGSSNSTADEEPELSPTKQVMSGLAVQMTRKIGALELGTVLGWMSRRVLGQYDLLLATDDAPSEAESGLPPHPAGNEHQLGDGDVVYYVGPNILATEKRYAFPPSEFRLWLALHELTHRNQFTGVPWLRPHFLQLVTKLVESSEPDFERIRTGLRSLLAERKAGRDPLSEGGLASVFATEQQRNLIDQVGGMMSLVEGHGDATMARAARGYVPSADRFHHVMHHRRKSSRGMARLLQRLMGIDAKLQQYQAGEDFIVAIESKRGERAVDRIWEKAEFLPSLKEIREPNVWMARVPAA